MSVNGLLRTVSALLLTPLLPAVAQAIVPVDITSLYMRPEQEQTILLSQPTGSNAAAQGYDFQVRDYTGALVGQGRLTADAQRLLPLKLTLPSGYYEVSFGQQGIQPVGLWVAEDTEVQDPFFSIDAAMSWLTKPADRPSLISAMTNVISDGGLSRERLSWNAINPENNQWNWETDHRYESTRQQYAQQGVPVLEMFHDAPAWMGKAQGGKFPDDLVAASRSWAEVSGRWHEYWGALDVWNEPDIGFGGNQPADQYVPLVKAIRYAMRSEGISTPIGGGVFAFMNPEYRNLAARNGLLDESDFFSFHYYGANEDPLGLEHAVKQYRDWLQNFGHGTKPMWLTEVGHHRAGESGVRPAQNVQQKTAIMYAMTAVEARACGVEALFPFVYTEYSEGGGWRHYGMVDHNHTPLRIMAASAQTAHMLAGTEYVGDLQIPGARRVRVFKPETEPAGGERGAIAVVYTGVVDPNATLRLPFAAKAARGIDGRNLPLSDDSRIPVPDGMVYLDIDSDALAGYLIEDTTAMALYELAREGKAAPQALPAVSSIVLQPQINPDEMQAITATGYLLGQGRETVTVNAIINNLGADPQTVSLWIADEPAGQVTVLGGEREVVTREVDVESLPRGNGDVRRIRLSAQSDLAERIAPAEISLIVSSGNIAAHLEDSHYHMALPINEAFRWDANANGELTFHAQPESSTGRGYDVRFESGKDPWAYPRFTLPQEVDHAKVSGVLIRARCINPASVKLMAWDDTNNISFTPTSIFPADGEWHVVYVPLNAFMMNPERQLRRVSVGINSGSSNRENTVEISDLYLIGK